MTEPQLTAAQEWRAHWPLVLSAMLGMSFYTVVTYSFSTFIAPLEKAFGWGRAEVSFCLTIFAAIAMIGGPFVGAAIDRFGTRRIAIGGLALSALAFAAFSLASGSIWQFYGLFVLYGLVSLAFKTTVWSAGIAGTFSTSRSLALSIMLSGSALGQTLAPLIAYRLISTHGWRAAYVGLGLGWGGVALLAVLAFFRDARERGRQVSQAPASSALLPGLTLREARRDSRILRIALSQLVLATLGSGASVHLVRIVAETGVSEGSAVQIAATAGLAGIAGKLITGWLLDRAQGSIVPFSAFACAAIAHLLLLNRLDSVAALTLGAMILGFSSGAGLQVTTYLVSRYAGMRNFGAIYGAISSMMMAGTAMGPLIAGRVHDVTGSYAPLLLAAAPIILVFSLLMIGLGPYPDFSATPDSEPA
ncbi:MAG: MFS transporter [Sphingomonadales bacterium]|nr:MFS transporter [Sphingomonadales bacterium]